MRFKVDIAVVPVAEASFERAVRKREYVAPNRRMRSNPKYIAFYRTSGIGAITHIARVTAIASNVPRCEIILEEERPNESWALSETFRLFKLTELYELQKPIPRIRCSTIQNRIYVSFEIFSRAGNLRDLFGSPIGTHRIS